MSITYMGPINGPSDDDDDDDEHVPTEQDQQDCVTALDNIIAAELSPQTTTTAQALKDNILNNSASLLIGAGTVQALASLISVGTSPNPDPYKISSASITMAAQLSLTAARMFTKDIAVVTFGIGGLVLRLAGAILGIFGQRPNYAQMLTDIVDKELWKNDLQQAKEAMAGAIQDLSLIAKEMSNVLAVTDTVPPSLQGELTVIGVTTADANQLGTAYQVLEDFSALDKSVVWPNTASAFATYINLVTYKVNVLSLGVAWFQAARLPEETDATNSRVAYMAQALQSALQEYSLQINAFVNSPDLAHMGICAEIHKLPPQQWQPIATASQQWATPTDPNHRMTTGPGKDCTLLTTLARYQRHNRSFVRSKDLDPKKWKFADGDGSIPRSDDQYAFEIWAEVYTVDRAPYRAWALLPKGVPEQSAYPSRTFFVVRPSAAERSQHSLPDGDMAAFAASDPGAAYANDSDGKVQVVQIADLLGSSAHAGAIASALWFMVGDDDPQA